MRKGYYIILALIVLNSCGVDTSIPFCEVAIFKESQYVWIPEYTYTDPSAGKEYIFHGTSSDQETGVVDDGTYETTVVIPYDHFDTLSPRPPFIWTQTKSKYVMVAIFNERIAMDQQSNQIANPEAMVWAWNTGMSTGREGSIGYADGCTVVDGVIQYGEAPEPLVNGESYILAIWAWNSQAARIKYSSREIPFTVEDQ